MHLATDPGAPVPHRVRIGARFVDFEAIRQCQTPQLFVSATNVETGKLRIFPHDKITAEVIAASACLPNLFRVLIAFEIIIMAYQIMMC